ncbi:FRG domain-containing protein [Aeromonas caviae]|uniref:FRG domain-containing protein n=1 Tax=Aeromonas caviae TaxID=648 RepID=UPI001F195C67|nr:FRG domain-containing protein [Aeromonas caviae]BDC86964.1 FRG domain-containing protein [Aeromonas caviae]
MEQLHASSLHELEEFIAKFGKDELFRGQLNHYGEPSEPSVIASFDRHDCIPSETMKWMRYASKVLEVLIGDHVNNFAYVQALLQHYGWRSFFVDCSSSPAVSAWFASHKYTETLGIDMCKDCDENFLLERKKFAQYDFEEGDGHLYVIDKSIAMNIGLIDLASLTIDGFLPRTEAQKAWLLGPTSGKKVPKECFVAHITANRSIFREYAALHGLTNTDSMFPPATVDPILKALLELPWREIESLRDPAFPVPVFKRALELPEYQKSFEKNASPATAFYQGRKISEMFDSIETCEGQLTGGQIISAPEVIIYGTTDASTPLYFPKIEKMLEGKNYLAFEINEIIKHPSIGYNTVYQKGVGIIAHALDLFEVCELVVMHPGLKMTKVGFSPGWFYRRESNGLWEREPHGNECNCRNDNIHKRHISALHIAEDTLRAP